MSVACWIRSPRVRSCIVSAAALALALFAGASRSALAQEPMPLAIPGPLPILHSPLPVARNPLPGARGLGLAPHNLDTFENLAARVPAAERPSLPESLSPQVGPLIKHYYPDVVDRRTTAFIPASIEDLNLTPIEMPDTDEHWVRVDLSEQILVAYAGNRMIRAFVVASGLPDTPTVTGEFYIRAKVRSQLMEGGDPARGNDYYLPNVEWVQYFYKDYGLHGTYWHYAFGAPRSHGCINMTNADAKWLWEFLGPVWDGHTVWMNSTADNPGSLVIVHE